MSYKSVSYILGRIFIVLGCLMILPMLVDIYYSFYGFVEVKIVCYLVPIFSSIVLGLILCLNKPEKITIYDKEGLVICGIGWIFVSIFGALPFYISGCIPSFIDAFFESASGFSTTGSSILSEISSLPKSILFWRSFTHWIGGMGILSFMIAIIPKSKGNSMYVMKAEVPGPKAGKVSSKISTSARILYIIYFVITILEIAVLFFGSRITGENLRFFDSVVTGISTAGTGGFSVLNDSIAGYHSNFVEWVCIIFMFLFGTNFNLYFYLITKRGKLIFKDEEFRAYIIMNLTAVLIITLNIMGMYDNAATALKDSFFVVNASMSSTGFCTADFNLWPTLSKTIVILLMFVGSSVGSTGGGMKILRIVLYVKQGNRDLRQMMRPNTVLNIRMNNRVVDQNILRGVNAYLILYLITLCFSLLIVSINGFDTTTTLTAVITCFNNIGPGLGNVGPTGNFAGFSILSKLVLIFDMLAGRLELFPLLVLLSPNTWKKAR